MVNPLNAHNEWELLKLYDDWYTDGLLSSLREGDVLLLVCPFVRLLPEMRTRRVLAGHAHRLSASSAAGPVRPMLDMLMAVGAYRVGCINLGCG